ncbi:TlpA disulfide reductase family protein [Kangiella sp.]|uniref:TlpA disulfide reductase family protein n=1 Tax=Kangiella sp. TaxID=1920245 RepID=UPI0019864B0C|nr:TlpA disulfide reductase family protein [Kangiella sp.]MBD3652884.1 TlpA family protein disulfide reductase [Kangiella sp.]
MMSLSIGPISLPFDRFLILVCLAIAFIVGAFAAKKDKTSVDGSIAGVFILAMLAARISFVVQYWSEYQADLWSIINIRDSGFDGVTAVIVGTLALAGFAWKKPKGRRALIKGFSAGALVWTVTTFAIGTIEDTSKQLPTIMVKQMNGETVDLNQVEQGKPRVINLWATWCPPCRREMPVLEEAQQNNSDIGFVFVNQGEHSVVIEQYLQQEALSLENVMADSTGSLGYQVGSRALPTTIFVNARGELVDAHLGELSRASLKAKLEKLTNNELKLRKLESD